MTPQQAGSGMPKAKVEFRGVGTIAIATRDLHRAERVADYVAVMDGGNLAAFGRTNDIFNSPTTPRGVQ